MPKITPYESTQTLEPAIRAEESTAYSLARYGRIAGQEYAQGGGEIGRAAEEVGQAVAQNETIATANKISNVQLQADIGWQQRLQATDPNNPEAVDKLMSYWPDEVQPKLDAISDNLGSRQAREYFMTHATEASNSFARNAVAEITRLHGEAAVNNFNGAVDNSAKRLELAAANGTLSDAMVSDAIGGVSTLAASLPVGARDKAVQQATNHLADFAAEQVMQSGLRDPNATVESLDKRWGAIANPDGPLYKSMSPGKLGEIQDQYLKGKMTLGAQQSALADVYWPDVLAKVRQGDPAAVKTAQQLAASAVGKEPGESAVKRERMGRELAEATGEGEAARTYRDMPQPQVEAQIPELQKKADAGGAEGGIAKFALQAIRQRDSDFKKDPLDYVLNSSDVVRSRAQAFAANPTPENFGSYAAAAAGEQQRLYPNMVPRLATEQMNATLGQAMKSIAQGPNGAGAAGQALADMASRTGKYWPNLAREFMQHHVLNEDQYAAAQLYTKPNQRPLADVLLSASSMTAGQRHDLHGIAEGAALKSARAAMNGLNISLANVPSAGPIIEANTTALAHLMQMKGVDPTDDVAVGKLANDLILDEFDFRDGGTLRVPKTQSGIDTDAIEAGADRAKKNASQGNAFADPHWYTSPDGKGATLYPQPGAANPVSVQGRPLTLTWQQLMQLGR